MKKDEKISKVNPNWNHTEPFSWELTAWAWQGVAIVGSLFETNYSQQRKLAHIPYTK